MRHDVEYFTESDVKRLKDRFGKKISVKLMQEPTEVIDGKRMGSFTTSYHRDPIEHIISEIEGVPVIGVKIRVGLYCYFREFEKMRYCLDIE